MSRAPQRAPLTRDRIVRAAVALADDNGIEAVSMRRLAKDLGVEAMSLYNHVENKGDLVDAMVDDVKRYAKSNPVPVLLGALAVGFLVGRMLRRD